MFGEEYEPNTGKHIFDKSIKIRSLDEKVLSVKKHREHDGTRMKQVSLLGSQFIWFWFQHFID
jgi:hypothetical protein